MRIVVTSPAALLQGCAVNPKMVDTLKEIRSAGHLVGVVSNHPKPSWFDTAFAGVQVQFRQVRGRQSGEILKTNAKKFSLEPYDVLVLAVKDEDVQMGKNGGAVLIAGPWATASSSIEKLGIRVDTVEQLREVIGLAEAWKGQWWYAANGPRYGVRALADLSTYNKAVDQQLFGAKVRETVKNGGPKLNALLAITARSLLMDGIAQEKALIWGVYPSSASANDDNEILSDFTHRLRTTTSRVRYCERGEPLFVRHKPAARRSGEGGDRSPEAQLATIHLNPHYKRSNRIAGRNVIVIDDCTTYGVSFGVAAALLRKANAASVTGVALGKFGNQLNYYESDIVTDPFAPIPPKGYTVTKSTSFAGTTSTMAQTALLSLIP